MRRLIETLGAIALLANVAAAANYNETVNGDLSDVPAAPTVWLLEAGDNSLTGEAGVGATSTDYDLVAFTVPAGHQLNSLTLNSYALLQTHVSFLGLQASPTWTTGFEYDIAPETLIGLMTFNASNIGVNLLPEIGANVELYVPGGGFTPPLPSGTYTMLLQDNGSSFTYGMTFGVAAVPEPATLALAAMGLIGVCAQRRRNER